MDANRNLLFGVMAFQNEYIDLAQFLAACRAWSEDSTRSIAELLASRGWVTEPMRVVIEDLIERKLKRYGGSPHMTLGAVADDAARDALRDVANPEIRRTLDALPPRAGHVLVQTLEQPTTTRSRYTLTRLHAEGGLGKVWVARDADLNREVALKELQPSQNSQQAWGRFFREAQVTGQLEHPNIVPVYELSRRPEDNQPFYTMRFVRGQTLRDAIADHHSRRKEGKDDLLERHRLLSAFVAVCQAMAYAHSRGVVHRDLKPDNVVLGGFGEVIVLDWGLAKLMDREDSEAAMVATTPTAAVDATMAGRVLGTPAYMAPEQAEGRLDLIDSRTDVYGLGAILFEILTGDPPHRGDTTAETIQRIVTGRLPRARGIDPTVPAALDEICAKAMARARPDRYFRAKDLADDTQRWLADEPVAAYREPWDERALRWARRHRAWTQAVAVALVAVAIVSAIAALVVNNARRNELRARQAETAAKNEATQHLRERRQVADELLTGVAEGLADVAGDQNVRLQLLQKAAQTYEQLATSRSSDRDLELEAAWARFRLGQIRDILGRPDDAEQDLRAARSKFETLLSDVPESADFRFGIASCALQLGVVMSRMGRTTEAEQAYDAALRTLESVSGSGDGARYGDQLARTLINLASLQLATGRDADAERTLRRTVTELTGLMESGRGGADYRYVLASSRHHLADVLSEKGNVSAAVDSLRAGIAEFEEKLRAAPSAHTYFEAQASCRVSLGNALQTLGHDDQAKESYELAVAEYYTLNLKVPGVPRYRAGLASALSHWGNFLERANNFSNAEEAFTQAIEAFQLLIEANPRVARYHVGLAAASAALAQVHRDAGRYDEAEEDCQRAIEEYESLIASDRANVGYQAGRAAARSILGQSLFKLERHRDAESEHQAAVAELRKLVEAFPARPSYRDDLAECFMHLGDLYHSTNRSADAMRVYGDAVKLREKLANEFPGRPDYQHRLAWLLATCSQTELRDPPRAAQLAESACSAAPTCATYWRALGFAHFRSGSARQAIQALEQSLKLRDDGDGQSWFVLAMAHGQSGETARATDYFHKATEWMAKNKPGDPLLVRLRRETATQLGVSEP